MTYPRSTQTIDPNDRPHGFIGVNNIRLVQSMTGINNIKPIYVRAETTHANVPDSYCSRNAVIPLP